MPWYAAHSIPRSTKQSGARRVFTGYPPPVGRFGESPGIPRARLGITGVKRYPKPALWTNADWRIRSRGRVAPQAFSRFERYCGVRSAPRTRLLGLTLSHGGRSFNQLTPAQWALSFPAIALHHLSQLLPGEEIQQPEKKNEQAYVPAEQPSSRQEARLPPSHAHPRRSCHPLGTPRQGPHRTLRLVFRCSPKPIASRAPTTIESSCAGVRRSPVPTP